MRAAIYGAGAMGTVLGAYITKAGYQIDLINRNMEHVKGLLENGAKIIGKTEFVQPVTALMPGEMKSKYDVILLMTKQLDNQGVVKGLVPYLEEDGVICTMQNGLPEYSVASVIGEDRTFGCAMSWGATMHGKGVVELTSEPKRDVLTYSIGKFGNNDQTHFDYVVELLNTMGDVVIEENFIGARWSKLLVNAAFSGLSVVTNKTFGEICDDKKARRLAQIAMKETIDVCKAGNIKIEPIQGKDIVKLFDYKSKFKRWVSFNLIPIAMKKHRNIKASMLNDLARNRLCEIDAINGVVCEYGDKVKVETPVNDLIVEITHKIEKNILKSTDENLSLFDQFLKE